MSIFSVLQMNNNQMQNKFRDDKTKEGETYYKFIYHFYYSLN